MKKFNPYQNIFYYYKGTHNLGRVIETQIEDNTTKTLINTFEYSNIALVQSFLENLKIPFSSNVFPQYDLQIAEKFSRPDAMSLIELIGK